MHPIVAQSRDDWVNASPSQLPHRVVQLPAQGSANMVTDALAHRGKITYPGEYRGVFSTQ